MSNKLKLKSFLGPDVYWIMKVPVTCLQFIINRDLSMKIKILRLSASYDIHLYSVKFDHDKALD